MFNITIVAIGKVRQVHIARIIKDYLERCAPYAKIKLEEIKAEKFDEHNHAKARRKEALRIEAWLAKRGDSRIILLDEAGKLWDSQAFTDLLESRSRPIIFVIAGALGWDPDFKQRYQETLSLSPMTLPHEMARLVLVEQIYRATTITNNKTYHY